MQDKTVDISDNVAVTYYLADMKRRNLSAETIKDTKRILTRFVEALTPNGGEKLLSQIDQDDVNRYLDAMQNRQVRWENHGYRPAKAGALSAYSLHKVARYLLTFGLWLHKHGHPNPFANVQKPKTPRSLIVTLTPEEIERVVGCMNLNTHIGTRAYAIFILMLDSGLRISEVANAKMSDLDLQERQLKVRGKGDKERLVPFGSDCAEILLRYINLYRTNARQNVDNIFISLDGDPLTRDSLEKIFQRLKASSGVKNLRPHVLRHTFSYNYLEGGGSVVDLQVILGHGSIETTMGYVRYYQMKNVVKYSKGPSPVDRMNLRRKHRFGRRPKPKSN